MVSASRRGVSLPPRLDVDAGRKHKLPEAGRQDGLFPTVIPVTGVTALWCRVSEP